MDDLIQIPDLTDGLREANRKIRAGRSAGREPEHTTGIRNGDLLELSVPCGQCPHDAAGFCIMCNYWTPGALLPEEEILEEAAVLIPGKGKGIRKLLLSVSGSMLDRRCVAEPMLKGLLTLAENCEAERIIIETHLDTINEAVLQFIRTIVKKPVILEVGLESVDPFVQHNCYLKDVPAEQLLEAFLLGKKYNMEYQLNLMLGAPFLSRAEQLEDAELSLRWALEHAAYAALFPLTVKPHTLLNFAFRHGMYSPVTGPVTAELLRRFTPEELGRIDVLWQGNEEADGLFYGAFNTAGPEERKALADSFLHRESEWRDKSFAGSEKDKETRIFQQQLELTALLKKEGLL